MLARLVQQHFPDHATDHIHPHGDGSQPGQNGIEMDTGMDQHHQGAQPGAEFMHFEQGLGVARGDPFALARRVVQRANDEQRARYSHIAAHPDQVQAVQEVVSRQCGCGQKSEQYGKRQHMFAPQ
jgi:hypothetical protein